MEKFNFDSFVKEKKSPVVDATNFQSGFDKIFAPYKNPEPGQAAQSANAQAESPDPNAYTEKDLSDSRSKGYEEGYAKGYKDAKVASDEINKKQNESLAAVLAKLELVLQEKNFADEKDVVDVAEIITRVAKKVADSAFAASATEPIEKVVAKSFEMLFNEPKIVISVGSDVANGINEKIELLAKASGFKGEFEIKADNNIGAGGCNIEWQGGGLRSDKDAIWQEIDKLAKDLFNKKVKKKA